MAKKSGLGNLLFVHGANLSGDVGRINNAASPRRVLEATGISSSAIERLLGPGDGVIDFTSWFNPAAGQMHPILSALPTTNIVLLLAMGGAVGDAAAILVAKQVDYNPERSVEGAFAFTTQALGESSPLEWGVMLTDGEDTVASGNVEGTTVTVGSSSANGGIGCLQIRDVDAATAAIAIEDSPDDSAWTTLLTFAANGGSTPIGERKTVAGAVDKHIHYDIATGFTNIDFAMAWRRGVAEDDVDLS